ncbi:MAG: alpha/beta fold hydrolase [Selenomonadaceae bacterium]|nr:alpha/beta fold hydrolase [Selenomonadaceae bacterium]
MRKIFTALIALMILFLPLNTLAKSRDVIIDGDHGKLSAVLQTPDDKVKYPLVILMHGFNADKEHLLITSLADELESRGIASIRFDFNGHGKSDGTFQEMTIPNEINDARKVYKYVRNLRSVTTISAVGHSQGGVIAGMLAGELGANKIKRIVLMAPAEILRDDALRGNLFRIKFDVKNPPETLDIRGKCLIGRDYIVTLQTLPIFETSEKFKGEALMIQGDNDTMVPYTSSLLYERIFKRGKVKIIKDADHSFHGKESQVTKTAADFLSR